MIKAGLRITTGSTLIRTGPGAIDSVLLLAGSDATSLIIYDNTSAAGTVVVTLKANKDYQPVVQWSPRGHVLAKGAYGVLAGTAAEAVIVYT